MTEKIVEYLINLLNVKGAELQYGGEGVSQLEHALQCADIAEQYNGSKEMITSALLHDIGHLLYEGKDPIDKGVDAKHEELAADFLSQYLEPAITMPIRAHVDCKRYLVTKKKKYYNSLSEASKNSLVAQGGPFTIEEAGNFIKKPFMIEAIELRKFDDLAKVKNKKTPPMGHFKLYIEKSFQANRIVGK